MTKDLPIVERRERLVAALEGRVLCIDGATGTWLQGRGLGPDDFGGEAFDGCNEALVLFRPDVVLDLHRAYLGAGADIVETNTFGGTDVVLGEYPPLHERTREINRRAAELARRACAEFDRGDALHWVAGSMGPTTRTISVGGGVTFDRMVATYRAQAQGLLDGGVDYLLLETCQDTLCAKAGLVAILGLMEERGERVPVAVSGTIQPGGTMLAGQSAEALWVSVAHADLLYVGVNCSTGPEEMADPLRALAEIARTRIACVPNAGLPDEEGRYLLSSERMAAAVGRFLELGWLNLVGGCCGTNPGHIEALASLARRALPRRVPEHRRSFYSGVDLVEAVAEDRPLLVGERTNVIGSRRFKRLVGEGKFEEAAEIARAQVRQGAQIVDVCLANPDRDELADMDAFLRVLAGRVRAPLMIDSTDPAVVERALTFCQGKALINSVNLEEGSRRIEQIVPLVRRFGAALVVGCIDGQGMAVTADRKLEVAVRAAGLLTSVHGLRAEDLVIDPLTFPCATGDTALLGSARATVEGVRRIREALPDCRTILGISNVSFGLPPAGREVVASVFLHECTLAGLDLAIVNAEGLRRHASLSEEERALAAAVLFEPGPESTGRFVAAFREVGREARAPEGLSPDERLRECLVQGTKEGLEAALDELLEGGRAPLAIVDGPLLSGMDQVGRLFAANRLIVAEVLQSAEVMRAAVRHLQPHMTGRGASVRGKVLLATVRGDVHDIGKNLVDLVLSNNGYEVIDLGTRVPNAELVRAVREHRPHVLGLSGLLVRSAQAMVAAAEDLSSAGCAPDLLVGGAALSATFVRRRIAPVYAGHVLHARDAMDGLMLANRLGDPKARPGLLAELAEQREDDTGAEVGAARAAGRQSPRARVAPLDDVPAPPDVERHVLCRIDLDEVWRYVNPRMLYGRHLGFRGDFAAALAAGEPRAVGIDAVIEGLRAEAREGRMEACAVWRFVPAASDGDVLHLFRPGEPRAAVTWALPRGKQGLALPDWVLPAAPSGEPRDAVALFVVSAGKGVGAWSADLKRSGAILASYAVQALALETAEASAEWLHARLREQWGFPDPAGTSMEDRFRARYRGRRYSPGYAACPDLEMQRGIWDLLDPGEIGVELTDGLMMDPEASVSAMVVHHPQARYFSAER